MTDKKSLASKSSTSDVFEVNIEKGVITPAISTSIFSQVSEHLDKKLLFNCPEDFEPDASFIQLLFILRIQRVDYTVTHTFTEEQKSLLEQTGLAQIL